MVKKRIKRRLIYIAVLAVLLLAMVLLSLSAAVSEWWTTTVSRGWIFVFSNVTGLLPFSLTEVMIAVAVLFALSLIVWGIVLLAKRKFINLLSGFVSLVVLILSVAVLYFMSAGFAYNRDPIRIPQYTEKLTADQIYEIAEFYLEDYNMLAESLERDENGVIKAMPFDGLVGLLEKEYERLDPVYFSPHTPRAKQVTASPVMSAFGINGMYFAPFGEANVSRYIGPSDLPKVVAHEMAHAKGIAREKEANLTAFYLLLTSENGYLRYSAYMSYFGTVLQTVYLADNCDEARHEGLKASISPFVDKDFQYNYDMNTRFDGWLDDVGNWFNNLYLKMFGSSDGTGSYYDSPDVDYITDENGEPVLDENGNQVIEVEYSIFQQTAFAVYIEKFS